MSKADWTKAFQELMKLENTPNALLKQMVGGMANLHDDLREILLGSELSLNRVNEIMAKVEAAAATNAASMMSGVPRAVQTAYVDSTLLFDELLMSFETVYPMGIAAMPAADMGTYAVTNTTGLITAVTREIQFQVSAEVLQGILLERKPTQVMQRVSHVLGIRSTGQFREFGTTGISYKAEKIVRTEMMATANAGFHDRMKIAGQTFPDLEKVWMATGDWRCRDEHLTAHSQKVPHDGEFIVGGESCQFPLDPSLSARMRINCRCGCVPYRPSWGELGELTGVLDNAVALEKDARKIIPAMQLKTSPSMALKFSRPLEGGKWQQGFTNSKKFISGMFTNMESNYLGVPVRKGAKKVRKLKVAQEKFVGGRNVQGEFARRRVKNRYLPQEIRISPVARSQGLTYAHEYAHLIDSHYLTWGKTDDMASSLARSSRLSKTQQTLMDDLMKAFSESEAIGVQLRSYGSSAPHMRDYYAYSLQKPEVFAQGFSQYVAVKSGDALLLEEMAQVKQSAIWQLWWKDDDFDPIRKAFDSLFEGMGWL